MLKSRCLIFVVHFLLLAQKKMNQKKTAPREIGPDSVGNVPFPDKGGDFNIRRSLQRGGDSKNRLFTYHESFCGRGTGLHFRKGIPKHCCFGESSPSLLISRIPEQDGGFYTV